MKRQTVRIAFSIGLAMSFPAIASPTSNEFEECHRQASAVLNFCLNRHTNQSAGQSACREQSRRANVSCYQEVRNRHDRGLQQQRKAAAQREAARLAASQEKK